MQLEYLKVGRNYRVRQGRKLLVLRLKEILTLQGVGTELYELKITTEGYRLWMMDERIGKGYTITALSCIEDEIPEKPVEGSLVQITKGVLTKSLGSVTLYRVKEVGRDADTNKETVTLAGPWKNYVCWMADVRVYEGKRVDPETLLSKESKAVGDKPRRFLPGPAVGPKTGLANFMKKTVGLSMGFTGEEKKTKEDKDKEKLQAELDKKKEEYADQQHAATAIRKKTEKDLYQQGTALLKAAKKGEKCQPDNETQDDESSESTGQQTTASDKQPSSSSTGQRSSTANTVSKPSKHFVPTPSKTKPPEQRAPILGKGLGKREPKARKEKLEQAIKRNKNLKVEGRSAATESRMPALKKTETEDSEDDRSAQITETDTSEDADTVISLSSELNRLSQTEDEDTFDARVHKKVILEAPVPEHLNGVGSNVIMSGLEISSEYWKGVERRKEEKKSKKGRKK